MSFNDVYSNLQAPIGVYLYVKNVQGVFDINDRQTLSLNYR